MKSKVIVIRVSEGLKALYQEAVPSMTDDLTKHILTKVFGEDPKYWPKEYRQPEVVPTEVLGNVGVMQEELKVEVLGKVSLEKEPPIYDLPVEGSILRDDEEESRIPIDELIRLAQR